VLKQWSHLEGMMGTVGYYLHSRDARSHVRGGQTTGSKEVVYIKTIKSWLWVSFSWECDNQNMGKI